MSYKKQYICMSSILPLFAMAPMTPPDRPDQRLGKPVYRRIRRALPRQYCGHEKGGRCCQQPPKILPIFV
jgi:hypothetical protein